MCVAALMVPSFAQTVSGNQPHARNPIAGLQKALNLSQAQVSQIQGLFQSQRSAMQPLRADVKAKRQALHTALQGNDTSAIGSAMLALRSSEAALKNARAASHKAFMAVLSPSQAQMLTDYETVSKALGGRNGFGARSRRHGRAA
jgi:Spy/CpxP family protein refolding chaperone